jgi:hypothetical protein
VLLRTLRVLLKTLRMTFKTLRMTLKTLRAAKTTPNLQTQRTEGVAHRGATKKIETGVQTSPILPDFGSRWLNPIIALSFGRLLAIAIAIPVLPS